MEAAALGPSGSTQFFQGGRPYWDDTFATEPEQTDAWLTVEEVRRLCQEAIARGQARDSRTSNGVEKAIKAYSDGSDTNPARISGSLLLVDGPVKLTTSEES